MAQLPHLLTRPHKAVEKIQCERRSDTRVIHQVPSTELGLWANNQRVWRQGRFDSWVGKIPWRRDRLPTPVFLGFLMVQLVKDLPAMWETRVPSLGWEDPLEKGKATHSSILAWRIPWTV